MLESSLNAQVSTLKSQRSRLNAQVSLRTSNKTSRSLTSHLVFLFLRNPIHHDRYGRRALRVVGHGLNQEALAVSGDIVCRNDEGKEGDAGLEQLAGAASLERGRSGFRLNRHHFAVRAQIKE